MGLVSQEPSLFSMSIRDNIALGSLADAVSDDDVKAAARLACATEFIEGLPEGYSSPVGERGVKLSGGQKQRIAIARAVIRNPPIVLLDEATSALDTHSEREVQAALDNLVGQSREQGMRRTTLVIAHRLSTVVNVDRVVVLGRGRVLEQGAPGELMAKDGGYFRKLLDMQNAHTEQEFCAAPPTSASASADEAVETTVQADEVIVKVPSTNGNPGSGHD